MDNLLDFLPALIFFWILARALGGGRRRAARQRRPATTAGTASGAAQPTGGLGGFEELVRRLEEAQAQAQGAAAARAGGTPPPTPPSLPRARAADYKPLAKSPPRPSMSDFAFVGGVGEPLQEAEFHETHPLEVFDRPSAAMPSTEMPSDRRGQPVGAAGRRMHPLIERLRTVASAREAILLKDVLGPPRSRR